MLDTMQAKIHPHRNKVVHGETQCISITPMPKNTGTYYKAAVLLTDGSFTIHQSGVKRARTEQKRNVHAWATGTLTEANDIPSLNGADPAADPDAIRVTYHYAIGRFVTEDGADVTDRTFPRMACVSGKFFVYETP